MEWKYKAASLTGMWLASLAGAVYGLVFTIIGAGFDWGPGGGMHGPYWKIVLVGMISLLIGMYAGELIVRKFSEKLFLKKPAPLKASIYMLLICFAASLIAWSLSWYAGYLSGIFMGSIDVAKGWAAEIIPALLMMVPVFGLPFALGAGLISALATYFLVKKD